MANPFAKVKFKNFFDPKAVLKAADKAEQKNMSKWGAFTRQRAKQSIRKRKKSQPGGQNLPPSSHEGSLKRLIFFAFDKPRHTTVVGPLLFSTNPGASILEHGGMHTVMMRQPRRNDGTRPPAKRRRVKYGGNPTMTPAAQYVNENELPGIWANSIK